MFVSLLVQSCLFYLLFSDVDVNVTGIAVSELSTHNVSYRVLNDSVITIDDADKYRDTDESTHTDSSDSESDCMERNSQFVLILVIVYL